MDVCRLCLQNIDGVSISDPKDILQTFQKLVLRLSQRLGKGIIPTVCEICSENINSAGKLLKNKDETDAKIKHELDRLKVSKIDLRGFHRNINLSANLGVCRFCLKLINCPKIFLCESNTNILPYDHIKIMLAYCNIDVDLNLSHRPVMCTSCWENLNITYTFIKDFLEVERKIILYCQVFKLKKKDADKKILENVRNYFFSDEYDEVSDVYVKKEDIKEEPKQVVECPYITTRRTRIKSVFFDKDENITLMQVYYEVTKNENDFHRGYWKRLERRWAEVYPDKALPGMRLSQQIHNIVRKRLVSKAKIEEIKGEVNRTLRIQALIEDVMDKDNGEEDESEFDSDDFFSEEVVPSSFILDIKSEPILESDIEFNIIEPKLELQSDCESLPTLERMDNFPFDVTKIDSVEVKREVYENYVGNNEDNLQLESQNDDSINKSKRESAKLRSKEIFRCKKCNFETIDRSCVNRHAIIHKRMNSSIYACSECPYRISNKWLYKKHMKTHDMGSEIPVLEAQCYPSFDVSFFNY